MVNDKIEKNMSLKKGKKISTSESPKLGLISKI